ncbi:MAG TPA: NAD-binding protein, partial [Burkholderiaceae bacterium]|nr:NAD-binding protein [Burkholderiaceae bacterium]
AIVMVGKTLAAIALVVVLRYPLNSALTVGVSLAQIGEFSFILAGLGVALKLLPAEGQSLVLAGALISIALNPLLFGALEPVQRWLRARSALARRLEQRDDPLAELPMSTDPAQLAGQVVLVGHGRVGRQIAQTLRAAGLPVVVAEQNREIVEALREQGVPAVSGDATDPAVLVQAHTARAAMLVVATPDTFGVRKMAEAARTLNPAIEVVVRSHNEEEAALLERDRVGTVLLGERALAQAMAAHVLARVGRAAGG